MEWNGMECCILPVLEQQIYVDGVDLDLIEHDTTLNQGSTRVYNSQHKQAAYVLDFYHVEHIWLVVGI